MGRIKTIYQSNPHKGKGFEWRSISSSLTASNDSTANDRTDEKALKDWCGHSWNVLRMPRAESGDSEHLACTKMTASEKMPTTNCFEKQRGISLLAFVLHSRHLSTLVSLSQPTCIKMPKGKHDLWRPFEARSKIQPKKEKPDSGNRNTPSCPSAMIPRIDEVPKCIV